MGRAPRKKQDDPIKKAIVEFDLPPGHIPTSNTPLDAPTFYADSVQGAMVSDYTAKLFFLEHWVPSGQTNVIGRYSHALAVPYPQLRAMGELFIKLADALDKSKQADGNPEAE